MKRSLGNSLLAVFSSRLARSWWLWLSVGVTVGLIATFFVLRSQATTPPITQGPPLVIQETAGPILDPSFAAKQSYVVASGTRILLIPHHLVAGREIASLLTSVPTPNKIILLSPDHFSQGKTAFSTTKQGFIADGQEIAQDSSITDPLLATVPELTEKPDVFKREHGVRNLLPFFARAWGHPTVTPITLRVNASKAALDTLVQAIVQEMHDPKKNILLVATIDLSHYQPANVADVHDIKTLRALRSLDAEAASSLEIDSPPTFYVMTSIAKELGLGAITVHAQTNSLRLMNAEQSNDSTSHAIASFAPGETSPFPVTTTLLTDDRLLVSQENRFYQGFDRVEHLPRFPFNANIGLIESPTTILVFIFPFEMIDGHRRTSPDGRRYRAQVAELHEKVRQFLAKTRPRQDKPYRVE